jgi:Shwachman-Bodian-Diamond syndrome (SBDS) protein
MITVVSLRESMVSGTVICFSHIRLPATYLFDGACRLRFQVLPSSAVRGNALIILPFSSLRLDRHGTQGQLDTASKQTLQNEFETSDDDEVIKKILEKGTVQEVKVRCFARAIQLLAPLIARHIDQISSVKQEKETNTMPPYFFLKKNIECREARLQE